ncbi:uncharacterized mitochondrial protein AtMg00810-like [Panicum virgatum]|uniref:uncharacterized mitochondrial protein AtMg00810-like n=1 Tax=Panicum virgatum TaxID=38727 RepID=UPI0019D5E52A|nr:uncharacterized mitochondrial protein AtMg00810-like [Panicum virgatum]
MQSQFEMSDLGLLSFYLGIEVDQRSNGICLSQAAYARNVLEKMGMAGCNSSHTPMEPRLKLSKVSSSPPVDATEYRGVVGSLRYLVHTRPDISFSVGRTGREAKLLGYSDADMGGGLDTRKSTTGVLFFFGSCAVS